MEDAGGPHEDIRNIRRDSVRRFPADGDVGAPETDTNESGHRLWRTRGCSQTAEETLFTSANGGK